MTFNPFCLIIIFQFAVNLSFGRFIPNLANSLLNTKTHIYILQGPTRQEQIQKLFFALGLNESDVIAHVTFVPIVDAQLLLNNISYIKDTFINKSFFTEEYIDKMLAKRAIYRNGRLACFMTHFMALKLFQSSSYNSAIIFEDDAQVAQTNEIQLLYGLNSTNTYPTASSKQFVSYTDNEKQLVLLNRMLWMHPGDWDIQYLGYCYECGIANTFPFDIAKRYYRNHGIDAFLSDTSMTWLTHNNSIVENKIAKKINNQKIVMEMEDVMMSNYYYYIDAIWPMCLHSYRINKKLVNEFLVTAPPRWHRPNELGIDAFLLYNTCKFGFKKIRSIIPIFGQYHMDTVKVSLLNHEYRKQHESPENRCAKPHIVCNEIRQKYLEECIRRNISSTNCNLRH